MNSILLGGNATNIIDLAQRDYFKRKDFCNYLKYLLYWKRPEYAKFLKYPQALHFLELLQFSSFRDQLANTPNARYIEDQQLLQWQYYIRKRMRLHEIPSVAPSGGSGHSAGAQAGAGTGSHSRNKSPSSSQGGGAENSASGEAGDAAVKMEV